MIYDISHRTTFTYGLSVSISQHLLHLAPRMTPNQITHSYSLMVAPAPTLNQENVDFFGNPTAYLTVEEPHNKLNIISTARVAVSPAQIPDAQTTLPWEQVPAAAGRQTSREALDAQQYIFESPFTASRDAADYAGKSFPPGCPVLSGAIDLMSRIFNEFKYEGGVTDISTPIDQVLVDKRGVCQDFAHLQIACLRSLGLPARYVSGYLRTHPPEGQEKKIGADASHAWLAVWVPDHGWVDLDPTNNLLPGDEHITVAWGRDYGDVSPINGMVLGGGAQKIEVAVDVRPVQG
ncbi:MAG: transglutaminase family protein [Rhodospirillales bacterium]